MKKLLLGFFLITVVIISSWTQEIKTGTIVVYGKEYNLKFIEKDGSVFISWDDLSTALPNWFIVNRDGKIEVSYELMMLLAYGAYKQSQESMPNSQDSVIESRIDGEFNGWDGETIFKLQNGQIWEQDEYAYTYSYKYSPRVTIYRASSGWMMQVEGMTKAIRVRQIR